MNDRVLDLLLTDWSSRQRLSPGRAEAIRAQIVTSAPITVSPLAEGWWHGFSAVLTSSLRRAALPPLTIGNPAFVPAK